MYYITNQNNQIIAVDSSLLALLKVKNIDGLYKDIALGNIHFSSLKEENEITITKDKDKKVYDVKSTDLSGMLGNITLIQIQAPTEESLLTEDETPSVAEDKNESIEELLSLDVAEEEKTSHFGEALISIKNTDDVLEKEEDVLFDLPLPVDDEETIDKITITEDEEVKANGKDHAPIAIDVKNISRSIGISTEDYNTFLNEYIDTALSLKEDLQSNHREKRSNAIGILSHLSNVLHLPAVNTIITQIDNATAENQSAHIESFYATLARLSTSSLDTDNTGASSVSIIGSDIKVKALDFADTGNINIYEEGALSAPETESTATTNESFGSIDLDDVKPIHFDFQLKQAASELSLPVELIEEFVHDFIEQAHTETKKMLEAYEKGDLDTIQKIGHLLKGASSNLRITPLSDTLYEIQFCKDSNKLEKLIKRYWGHFLSLETQINIKRK